MRTDIEFFSKEWETVKIAVLRRVEQWDHYQKWPLFAGSYGKPLYFTAKLSGLPTDSAVIVADQVIRYIASSTCHGKDLTLPACFLCEMLRNEIWYCLRKDPQSVQLQYSTGFSHLSFDRPSHLTDAKIERFWRKMWKMHLKEMACNRIRVQSDPADFQLFHLYVTKSWSIWRLSHVFRRSWSDIFSAIRRQRRTWQREIRLLEQGLQFAELGKSQEWSVLVKQRQNQPMTH